MTYIQKQPRKAFVLTLTLIVLVLLTIMITGFQIKSLRHTNTSRYRVSQIKCRYAAESAIIAAGEVISNVVADPDRINRPENWADFKALLESSVELDEDMLDQLGIEDPCQLKDMLGFEDPGQPSAAPFLDDPCSIAPEDDPCVINDPFIFLDEERQNRDDYSPNIFHRDTIQVGDVEVEIIIYDENSKFPLLWVLHSPIYQNKKAGLQAFNTLGEELDIDRNLIRKATELAEDIGKEVKVPEPPYYFYKLTRRRGKETTVYWRKRASRVLYQPRGRENPSRAQHVYYELLRQVMADFSEQWMDRIKADERRDLTLRIPGKSFSFADYVGYWGNTNININTAPVEVIHATLAPFGITREQAVKIIELRTQTPVKNINQLAEIESIDNSLLYAMRDITRTGSNTFSIKVIARKGKARYSLIGGMHLSQTNNTVLQAIFPGD